MQTTYAETSFFLSWKVWHDDGNPACQAAIFKRQRMNNGAIFQKEIAPLFLKHHGPFNSCRRLTPL